MSTFAIAAITPKSASGGVSDSLGGSALTATTSAPFTIGLRTHFRISLGIAADTAAPAGVHIRFGLGSNPTAIATDFFIPIASVMDFYTGEEFDRIALLTAGTGVIPYITRFTTAG